jgi:hypothetical protein
MKELTSASGLKNLKSGRQKPKKGDQVFEVDEGVVVWESARRILICKCAKWEWKKTVIDGVTYFWKECVAYTCEEPSIITGTLK